MSHNGRSLRTKLTNNNQPRERRAKPALPHFIDNIANTTTFKTAYAFVSLERVQPDSGIQLELDAQRIGAQ